ncbi:MAG: hypothetical protein IIC72_12750 [Acidobacteria bacterium]|nr:hypothetical protein [Acidobacteriota bacterium]
MIKTTRFRKAWILVAVVSLAMALLAPTAAAADPDPDDGTFPTLVLPDRSEALIAHDAEIDGIVSSGPTGKTQKNVTQRGRGDRFDAGSTTDVWALGNYAYTGTFNSPCGGDPDAGVWIWDVRNPNKTKFVDIIQSPTGSRANDVKVASMNSGDILVHSNEACALGGPGGFEIYDVDDPSNPISLASVQTDDVNALLRGPPFFFTDFGVHNLFLFTQGSNDYVGAVVNSEFGNFQIFDITDPTSPSLVGFWGAESNSVGDFPAPHPLEDYATLTDFSKILDADAYLFDGFGASQNRFLHDITITADGTQAYLANWDAGLILLDISDVTDPQLVSVALDVDNGSLDGEVNSHAVWPSEDGSIVVEGEEDFSAWEAAVPPGNLTLDGPATPGDPTIPATAIATDDGDFFEANQTGLTGSTDGSSVIVDGGDTILAIELATAVGSPTFTDTGTVSGDLVWIGRACALTEGDAILNPGDIAGGGIAIVRRGACEFDEKAQAAAAAGADAVVIANNIAPSTEWSGLRIWDYSDPANPVLASTFNTTCSASTTPAGACATFGTYSVHNVIVETTGNKVKAYVSWYSDGMLVLDVSDPWNPVEVGRFLDASTNDGLPNNFWGVYKVPNNPFFYGSDRNGGLYTFKEQGSGSG